MTVKHDILTFNPSSFCFCKFTSNRSRWDQCLLRFLFL